MGLYRGLNSVLLFRHYTRRQPLRGSQKESFLMAKRRIFSLTIVDDDVFLSMPISAQALYFHLGMRADDDGFITPLKVMRAVGANQDDLNILIAKRYVLAFNSGVVVVKHWLINNTIRGDRYHKTTYQHELSQLTTNEWGGYSEIDKITTKVLELSGVEIKDNSFGNLLAPEPNLTKPNLTSISKDILVDLKADVLEVFNFYVRAFNAPQTKLSDQRKLKIKARLKDCGKETILIAITNTANSPFHTGDNDRGWKANIDFIIKSYEQVEKLSELNNVKEDIKLTKEEAMKYV
jgi:hypothetical protein